MPSTRAIMVPFQELAQPRSTLLQSRRNSVEAQRLNPLGGTLWPERRFIRTAISACEAGPERLGARSQRAALRDPRFHELDVFEGNGRQSERHADHALDRLARDF